MMSASGIALMIITVSLLKAALCSRPSAPFSALAVDDDYEKSPPGTDPKPVMTVPHLSGDPPIFELGHVRQKRSHPDKRQFSPWGGKRLKPVSNEGGAKTLLRKRSIVPVSIRNFSSWGGKRNWNGGKRYPLSVGRKVWILSTFHRNPKRWYKKHGSFVPWGVLRSFNSWGGKRSFNSWGGKKSFNSWGGKRSFNSWGGKKSFNSWGGKRAPMFRVEKEVLTPEEENVYNKWKRNQDKIFHTTSIQ